MVMHDHVVSKDEFDMIIQGRSAVYIKGKSLGGTLRFPLRLFHHICVSA